MPRKAASESRKRSLSGFGGPQPTTADPPQKKARWQPRTDNPPNRGNKPLPVGAPDCLAGKVFVITGVLDSLLREECADLCKEYGARVVSAVSGKVTHGIVGAEPGASKMSKLDAKRIPKIDEDGLFAMINASRPKEPQPSSRKNHQPMNLVQEPVDVKSAVDKKPHSKKKDSTKSGPSKSIPSKNGPSTQAKPSATSCQLWVDKYKPTSKIELVANQKAINDLSYWLSTWKSKFLFSDGHSKKLKDRSDSEYAAALLVGPPGIGKTTAAHIVCREAGFEPHEFNASDVRNKGGVQVLGETVMVANTMSKYFSISKEKKKKKNKGLYPHGQVLIMDEVDGMSGGDRGGSQELIRLIKKSKVPIICIANDDSSSNMRSLANNCFKIRFRKPMTKQVTSRLRDIVRKEGFGVIQDQTLAKLAEGCNGDIRQMINLLQAWRTNSPSLSFGDVKNRLQSEGKTVIQKSVFELARSFFQPGIDGSSNSLMARIDSYFTDADLIPLFIQENYPHTMAATQSLEALADAAECISEGDLCNSLVRGQQRWDLMPTGAVLSSLRPGTLLAGGIGAQIMFPSLLGNISKGNKWNRIVQGLEMKIKAAKTSSGSTRSFRLDYIPSLTACLATPLIRSGEAGIDEVTERLDSYYLEREPDWIDVLECGVYGKGRSPLENIRAPVKSAFTRAYNAGTHARSTVTGCRVGVKTADTAAATRKSSVPSGGEDVAVVDDDLALEIEEDGEEESDDNDFVQDFGKKQPKRAKKGGKPKAVNKTSSGKGTRSGRGRGKTAANSRSTKSTPKGKARGRRK
eukprot:TRINITY_DN787_c0_g1_i1.p2 TRINITY_DN787_c0_g1~~TRINITY_DN787_c0_g1_i1.p2  ORF type:complete len:828 (-),score=103.26 TRINITY_DN787_c0_g1_i1:7289-9691(-)